VAEEAGEGEGEEEEEEEEEEGEGGEERRRRRRIFENNLRSSSLCSVLRPPLLGNKLYLR
jgi:hypothetical protein